MRQFAIGDIHGCNKTLNALLERLHIQPKDEFYFLGDYVDRGPDSKGVFNTIFDLRAAGHKVVCLKGNHEQMMLDASSSPDEYKRWLSVAGGITTYRNFLNVDARVFKKYTDFMHKLPLVHTVGNFILVHGGLNFSQKDPLSSTHQMMWLRDWYSKIDYDWLGKRYILHGHTPMRKAWIEDMYQNLDKKRVLNLDNGCVFQHDSQLAHLACFEMQNRELFFQENVEGDYDD